MKEINVVKTEKGLRGWTDEDQRDYARMKQRIEALQPGEFARVGFSTPRNVKHHRKLFALLNLGFEHWDPPRKHRTYKGRPVEKSFEAFRKDVTILAGWYEQTFDLRGRMRLEAKSISFDAMPQEEFDELYNAVVEVLLKNVLENYDREDVDEVIEKIERFGS